MREWKLKSGYDFEVTVTAPDDVDVINVYMRRGEKIVSADFTSADDVFGGFNAKWSNARPAFEEDGGFVSDELIPTQPNQ